jgi:hypothetical protein
LLLAAAFVFCTPAFAQPEFDSVTVDVPTITCAGAVSVSFTLDWYYSNSAAWELRADGTLLNSGTVGRANEIDTFSVGGSIVPDNDPNVTVDLRIQSNYEEGYDQTFSQAVSLYCLPGAPAIGTATAGNAEATVTFTPPAYYGGSAISSYTATCGAFSASGPGSPITVTGLANGTTHDCSVTATNTVGTGPPSGATSVTPTWTSFSGPSATGTGTITASFNGGGAACNYAAAQFLGSPPNAAPIPPTLPVPGVAFPHGMFAFTASGCAAASTLNFTITYPTSVAGTTYWKYGPTAADPAPHWYVLPATLAGNTATFTITDGGLGDDDLAANGTIVDQGGPGSGPAIPTLSESALWLLAALLAAGGAVLIRTRG